MKLKMTCEVCGSESTFRMSGDSMVCNACNEPIAVGAPAREKWKVYQETLKKVQEEATQATTRAQEEDDIDRLGREAERMEKNMPPEEVDQSERRRSEPEYEEEEDDGEQGYTEEEFGRRTQRTRSHFVDEPDDAQVAELVKLTQNTIVILGICKKILEERGLVNYIPALPKGYADIKSKFERLKIELGYKD